MKTYVPRPKFEVFLASIGKAFDMGGVLSLFRPGLTSPAKVRTSFRFFRSDVDAFRADWHVVGMDLGRAVDLYKSRYAEE